MKKAVKNDCVILITFLVGVIGIIYFVTSLYLAGSDPMLIGIPESYLSWMVLERLILIGMIVMILIIITYVLMEQRNIEESQVAGHEKPRPWRTEKDIREDLMRYYRDLGALKIVLKDGVMDAQSYNERKKYLEGMIKKKKQQLYELQHVTSAHK
jgi:uncharacterized membrane protein